ncbi:MAG: glycosyltransferase family 4 protein, partial [Bacilli bacterium]|nr:glycosyltransferase family 4 protein [Bacilli bacterium]
MDKKLRIRMLSAATSVSGQGVGSAYMEQVALVKENPDFEILEDKDKGKADIYHVHTVNPKYRMRMSKRHVNVMYVHFLPTTLNGSIKIPKLFFGVFKKYVMGTYRKADEIVVVNPIFIEPLVKLGCKKENITYIPNLVSKENFHKIPQEEIDSIRESYGIKKDAFVVLGCGQVQTRKGVLDYIECAKANPDLTFVWAGGFSFGAMTDGYKELKKIMENPPENVKFIGIVDRSKMNDVFNMSDVLFMPSFDELMPMAILEAVNSSKPVLLRDLELYKDIFFGYHAQAHDVAGFNAELRRLATDKEYFEKISALSDKIAAFYSKEHVGSMWDE